MEAINYIVVSLSDIGFFVELLIAFCAG